VTVPQQPTASKRALQIAFRSAVGLLDVLLAAGSLVAFAVLLTGGWEWSTRFGLLRAYTAGNLLYALAVLGLLRAGAVERFPSFLGVVDLARLKTRLENLCSLASSAVGQWDRRTIARILAGIIVASTIGKILNAYWYYGFCCGDDVEIHEMTFSRLFGLDWKASDLRSAVYPLGIIYPVQAAAVRLGVDTPESLILVGRLVVVGFSAASIFLTYRLAVRYFQSQPIALVAATVLAVSKVFSTFGSSELPGPVAATLLLGSSLFLFDATLRRLAFASLLMGLAAALRFSELIFVAPAVVALAVQRQPMRAAMFGLLATGFFLAFVGAADYLYWGRPFASLFNIIDFTLIRQQSSRGVQPFHYYFSSATAWINWVLLAFIAYGARRAPIHVTAWFVVPVLLLSCLPHKEARYLVAAMPFAAILAGLGCWLLFTEGWRPRWLKSPATWRLVVAAALVLAVVLEIDGIRFRRSDAAVYGARLIANAVPARVVALEQSWQAGGRLYLRGVETVLDISAESLSNASALERYLADSGAEYVGFRQQTLAGHGYEGLVRRLGFTELEPSDPPRAYRVFFRRPGPVAR